MVYSCNNGAINPKSFQAVWLAELLRVGERVSLCFHNQRWGQKRKYHCSPVYPCCRAAPVQMAADSLARAAFVSSPSRSAETSGQRATTGTVGRTFVLSTTPFPAL